VQDETDGQDLTELNARRLEKMLARQGCDDADAVARAVIAARDADQAEQPTQGAEVGMSKKNMDTLKKVAQLEFVECEITSYRSLPQSSAPRAVSPAVTPSVRAAWMIW